MHSPHTMDGEAGFTFPPVIPSPPMAPRAGTGAPGDPRAPVSPGALSPRSRLSRINKPSSSERDDANASPPASPELSIFELAELERKLVAGGSPVDRDAAAGTNASSSSTRLLDRERDSVLKSLSQILGEVASQVRDTDSRVAALEAANGAERAEREAWKVRAERAEGRAGDLERKLDATREELLAMHDKTASKVAKIAKDSAKSPEADSPRVSAMRREVESLDRYARETRAVVERLEAGAESLGREVRRLATGEVRTREQLANGRNLGDEETNRRLANVDARLEAVDAAVNVISRTTVSAHIDALRAEVTGAVAAAKDAAVERRSPARSALWSRRQFKAGDEQARWSPRSTTR